MSTASTGTTQTPPSVGRKARLRAIGAAVVCAVVIAGVVLVASIVRNQVTVSTGPLAIVSTPQPGADTAACKKLMNALPSTLGGLPRRSVQDAGDGVAAWGNGPTPDDALVLRCGIGSPQELTCSAELVQINGATGVAWLDLSSIGESTYIAADRTVRIALSIPDGSGTSAIQQMTTVISQTLPARAPCDPKTGQLLPLDTR